MIILNLRILKFSNAVQTLGTPGLIKTLLKKEASGEKRISNQ